jgi:hypothetical protein
MLRRWQLDDGLDGREELPLPDGIGKSLRGSAEEGPHNVLDRGRGSQRATSRSPGWVLRPRYYGGT